jgi:hypothetical protein
MHPEAKNFMAFVKTILYEYFVNKKVLDVGSGDINGNNRLFFENCDYEGNDVIAADNVTIVSKTKDLPFQDEAFDTIISTECFEHDPEYIESLNKIYITDDKYRLCACDDEKAEKIPDLGYYTIYHFALENDDKRKNYGVYVNGGLLVESCSINRLKY